MSKVLLDAYDLADQIKESDEVQNYLQLKREMLENKEAQKLIKEFQKVKELYEEVQRFGIFHPDYHKAKQRMKETYQKLRDHPIIGSFLEAEDQLDQLLYQVSVTIARSVSTSIKVPTNRLIRGDQATRGCRI